MTLLAAEIAIQMGCSNELLSDSEIARKLHGIGKIAIRDEILLKPSRLTPAEWTKVKRHPLLVKS